MHFGIGQAMKISSLIPLANFLLASPLLARLLYGLQMLHVFQTDGGILPILKGKIASASIHRFGLQCRHKHMAKYNDTWDVGRVMQPGPRGKTGLLALPLHFLFENTIVSIQKINRKGSLVTRTMRSHMARVRCARLNSLIYR